MVLKLLSLLAKGASKAAQHHLNIVKRNPIYFNVVEHSFVGGQRQLA